LAASAQEGDLGRRLVYQEVRLSVDRQEDPDKCRIVSRSSCMLMPRLNLRNVLGHVSSVVRHRPFEPAVVPMTCNARHGRSAYVVSSGTHPSLVTATVPNRCIHLPPAALAPALAVQAGEAGAAFFLVQQQMSCLLYKTAALLRNNAAVSPACMSPMLGHLAPCPAGAAPHQGAAEMRPQALHSTCAILWRVLLPWCTSACGIPGMSSQLRMAADANTHGQCSLGHVPPEWTPVLCNPHLRGGKALETAGLKAQKPLRALIWVHAKCAAAALQ
jgi:hypothetical protein